MAPAWHGDPVWFHGDVATGNLLVRDGTLAAVSTSAPPASAIPPATSCSRGRCCVAGAGRVPHALAWTRHLVAGPRLGAVEGADRARRRPREGAPEAALARRDIEQILLEFGEAR